MAAEMPHDAASLQSLVSASWKHVCDTPGVLRNTSYGETKRRQIGPSGVVAQFNPAHLATKRPATCGPASPGEAKVVRPYAATTFNFTKCKESERVIEVTVAEGESEATMTLTSRAGAASSSDNSTINSIGHSRLRVSTHPFFVNVNPLMDDHSLFVPWLNDGHPQVFSAALMREVILVASGFRMHPQWKFGFNSLSAWASVGHFHIHCGRAGAMFGDDGVSPLEKAERRLLARKELEGKGKGEGEGKGGSGGGAAVVLEELTGLGCKGFVFTAEGKEEGRLLAVSTTTAAGAVTVPLDIFAADALSSTAGLFIEHLVASNLPHTVVITGGGRQVFVIPRLPQTANAGEMSSLVVAVAEVMGVAVVYSPDEFEGLSDEMYQEALKAAALSGEELTSLEAAAKGTLEMAMKVSFKPKPGVVAVKE